MSDLALIDGWKLTLSEARVLLSLQLAADGFCDVHTLRRVSNRDGVQVSDERIRVLIHRLRAKLRKHSVDIVTRPGGYALTEASIAIIHRELQARAGAGAV